MLTLDTTPRPWQQITADLMGYSPDLIRMGSKKSGYWYLLDMCAAFDIEVTSIADHKGDPAGACMYVWQFGLDGKVYIGRTWPEYKEFLALLGQSLGLNNPDKPRKLYIYVHNLSYEFQFLRRWFDFYRVFATGERQVIEAEMGGICYKCSYKLTLASLKYCATDLLREHTIRKLVGDLDYDKPHGPWTPLTGDELAYCVNDVLILNALIDERRREDGGLNKIPMTKTSYVRNECRKACFDTCGYRGWIKTLRLTGQQYTQLRNVTGGGFTHSNPRHTGKIYCDVESYDIASSYPAVMVSEQYPMDNFDSDPGVATEADFAAYANYAWYCCVKIDNLVATEKSDLTISESKCLFWDSKTKSWEPTNKNNKNQRRAANGRLITAKHLITWITDVDYAIHKDFYHWDKMEVSEFNWAPYGYLPTPLVDKILSYYEGKTSLKGKDPVAYMRSKERVNSVFGMMLTDPVRLNCQYTSKLGVDDDEGEWSGWKAMLPDIEETIEKYNDNGQRFIWWPWGIWVTAHARRRVTMAIKAIGEDYIYCDTDSVKIKQPDKYRQWFEEFCAWNDKRMAEALEYHGFDQSRSAPKDKKGTPHPLGHFEFDGAYKRFKTLGAKRYMYEAGPRIDKDTGEITNPNTLYTTVAGCGKEGLANYLWQDYDNAFDNFSDELYVPADCTGKLTHTYGDYAITGKLVDCYGVEGEYHERSWVHLAPCTFRLGLTEEYIYWLANSNYIGEEDIPVDVACYK